jgi:hypothetical protein
MLLIFEKAYINDRIVLPVDYAFKLKVYAMCYQVLDISEIVQLSRNMNRHAYKIFMHRKP